MPQVLKPIPPDEPLAFNVLIKPAGPACNLACEYCYYLPKATLYPGSDCRMSEVLLELTIRQLFEAQPSREVTVAWQGGEPTLIGLAFYEKAVRLVERYKAPGQAVQYTLQTNGTLVDENWAAFFYDHHFLVGLSLDGPEHLHNAYRVNQGRQGSFLRVMRGWEALQKHAVDVNLLCALQAANAGHPLEVYHFFRDTLGAKYMQFIPVVERLSQRGQLVSERSVSPEAYGEFLIAIFDEWVRRDVGQVFIQTFDVALGNWIGIHSLCVHAPICGAALALEHNGDLYACDHYVDPEHLLGNIQTWHLGELVVSERQRIFGRDKYDRLPQICRACPVEFACFGGCPKDRFVQSPDGEPGLNYLCPGYRRFFEHIAPAMRQMADLLRSGHTAAKIMPQRSD